MSFPCFRPLCSLLLFCFTATAPTAISTLSLHDALPIFSRAGGTIGWGLALGVGILLALTDPHRSEEHTSELQSRGHLVCRLLLEKKKHSVQPDTHSLSLTQALPQGQADHLLQTQR